MRPQAKSVVPFATKSSTYAYYPDGSLNTISWSPTAGQFKYAYTANGQYQTITLPNAQARNYSYDDQGRLLSIANVLGATNLATFSYGYDVNQDDLTNTMLGQRVSMTANVPTQGFSGALHKYHYDPLYQLKQVDYPNVAPFSGEIHKWTYDAIGNRLTNQVNAATQTYGYLKNGANPLNGQELQTDGVNAYTYDSNGNQITRSGVPGNFTFGYDPDNRLATITGAASATYTYDYQGRRASKTVSGVTTTYLYDGLNLVRETTAATPTDYAFGPGIDEPLALYRAGTISYVDVDGLGTDIAENSTVGALSHSSIFDAWGLTKTETGTRFSAFGYTSREFGEAELWFYRARYVDPARGRFTQEDPIRFAAGLNFFTYVGGNPVRFLDPSGLELGDYWDIRATVGFYDAIAQDTSYGTFAREGAKAASFALRAFGMADAQAAAEFGGEGNYECAAARGILSLYKGLSLALPLLGRSSLAARAGPGLVTEARTFGTVSSNFWKMMNGSRHLGTQWHLDHWLFPRASGINTYWNLVALPARLNSFMNGAPATMWARYMVNTGIFGSLGAGAAAGAFAGLADCGCK